MKVLIVVAVLGALLLCYFASIPEYPSVPFGGGGGGGWGDPSNSGMILFAPTPQSADNRVDSPLPGGGGFWGWIWTEIVDWALQPIKDCITTDTCNQAGGAVGGGGGGGVPPQCGVDFCTPPGVLGAAGRQARRPRTELEEAMEIMR